MAENIYTLTNHSVDAMVYGENRTEKIFLIHFFQKNRRGIEKEHSFKKEIKKVNNIMHMIHKPHYVTKSFNDGFVYRFHNSEVFDNNLSMGKFCGKIIKINDSHILFFQKEGEIFSDFNKRVKQTIFTEFFS